MTAVATLLDPTTLLATLEDSHYAMVLLLTALYCIYILQHVPIDRCPRQLICRRRRRPDHLGQQWNTTAVWSCRTHIEIRHALTVLRKRGMAFLQNPMQCALTGYFALSTTVRTPAPLMQNDTLLYICIIHTLAACALAYPHNNTPVMPRGIICQPIPRYPMCLCLPSMVAHAPFAVSASPQTWRTH